MPGFVGLSKLAPEMASVYSTLRLSPSTAFKLPLLSVSADDSMLVAKAPLKMPVLTPVSFRVTVSISPVVELVTLTETVPMMLVSKFWSASVS